MFCFITSLRSPQVAENWQAICGLFERTAASVFSQTCPEFRLIVVCNQLPILSRAFDNRLEFIIVDLPVQKTHGSMCADKLKKLLIAMQRVRELNADYVMPIDADDLVSRNLVSHVLKYPDADGWYVARGWKYQYGRHWKEKLDDFNRNCGTCNVLARRWFAFPNNPEQERKADAALITHGHDQVIDAFTAQGARLRPFPFRAATYIRHKENASALSDYYQPRNRSKN